MSSCFQTRGFVVDDGDVFMDYTQQKISIRSNLASDDDDLQAILKIKTQASREDCPDDGKDFPARFHGNQTALESAERRTVQVQSLDRPFLYLGENRRH